MSRTRTTRIIAPTGARRGRKLGLTLSLTLGTALGMGACADRSPNMNDQARYEPYERSNFDGFANHASSRPLVEGSVYQQTPAPDDAVATGLVDGQPVALIPIEVDLGLVQRGQERFAIACAMCHGEDGSGEGIVVQRGFTRPPSFHSDRLRQVPDGHIFRVMTLGFGRMGSYREQLVARDRWAVVAYIRALQVSQHTRADELPAEIARTLARQTGGDDE